MTQDEDRVWSLHKGFVAANRTATSQFLKDNMVPGPDRLVWYNLNQSNYIGVDHIAGLWDAIHSTIGGKQATFEAKDERLTLEGDMALVTYLAHISIDLNELGSWTHDLRTTEVWQKLSGEWKMIHFHCSIHVPGVMSGL